MQARRGGSPLVRGNAVRRQARSAAPSSRACTTGHSPWADAGSPPTSSASSFALQTDRLAGRRRARRIPPLLPAPVFRRVSDLRAIRLRWAGVAREPRDPSEPLRFLYWAPLQRSRGALDLAEACLRLPLDEWRLTMAGADTHTAPGGSRCGYDRGDVRRGPTLDVRGLRRRAIEDLLRPPRCPRRAPPLRRLAPGGARGDGIRLPVLATPVGGLTEIVEPGQRMAGRRHRPGGDPGRPAERVPGPRGDGADVPSAPRRSQPPPRRPERILEPTTSCWRNWRGSGSRAGRPARRRPRW